MNLKAVVVGSLVAAIVCGCSGTVVEDKQDVAQQALQAVLVKEQWQASQRALEAAADADDGSVTTESILDQLKRIASHLAADIPLSDQDVANTRGLLGTLDSELNELQRRLAAREIAKADALKSLETLLSQLQTNVESPYQATVAAFAARKGEFENLKNDFAAYNFDAQIAALQQQLRDRQAELEQLKVQPPDVLQQVQSTINDIQNTIHRLNDRVNGPAGLVTSVNTFRSTLSNTLEPLFAAGLHDLQPEINQLRTKIEQTIDQLNETP